MVRNKRIINVNVLPGEPTDGSGRVCVHLFIIDENGPFVEPSVLHPARDEEGKIIKKKLVSKPTRGRLACNPKRLVAPKTIRGVIHITHRTNDPYAVSCPKCIASKDYELLTSTNKSEIK